MALVDSNTLLREAQKGHYAVGAFNVENMEMIQAVIEAAEEMGAPVILQTTPSTVRYAGLEAYAANVKNFASQASVPVVLHLDHGDSFALCAQAVRAGYTSVMFDGSRFPLEENIRSTRRVVELGQAVGIPVEGELGQVGGKEDDLSCESTGYTIPEEAVRFEKETGVSSMAVGVGTAHGIYQKEPVLRVDLVEELREQLQVPMVLHGASGLSEEAVRECIWRGICKVNFATELRQAYTNGVQKVLQGQPGVFDPKVYGKEGIRQVKEIVKNRMRICGCCSKA